MEKSLTFHFFYTCAHTDTHTHTQMTLLWECTHPEILNYTLRIGLCCNVLQEIFKFVVGKKLAFTTQRDNMMEYILLFMLNFH